MQLHFCCTLDSTSEVVSVCFAVECVGYIDHLLIVYGIDRAHFSIQYGMVTYFFLKDAGGGGVGRANKSHADDQRPSSSSAV